jgi:hypothetical protein
MVGEKMILLGIQPLGLANSPVPGNRLADRIESLREVATVC